MQDITACEPEQQPTEFRQQWAMRLWGRQAVGATGKATQEICDRRPAHLREGFSRALFMVDRQGEVSMTMGMRPPSDALSRAASYSLPLAAAGPVRPRLPNIIPQHWDPTFCSSKGNSFKLIRQQLYSSSSD